MVKGSLHSAGEAFCDHGGPLAKRTRPLQGRRGFW